MSSQLGMHQIAVNTSSLADGSSIASYLVDAAGNLLNSVSIGGNQSLYVKSASEYAEDSAHTSGDYGSFVMGVRNDAGSAFGADGDYVPLSIDASGALRVSATFNAAGDYAEDSAHSSGDIGLFQLAVRRDTRSSGTSADGDYASFNVNGSGELWVKDADSLAELVLANASLDAIEASAASIDTSLNNIETDIDEMNTSLNNIESSASSIDTSLNNIESDIDSLTKLEDAAHSSGDAGIMALSVRNDTLGSLVSANGDYAPLQVNASGALYVALSSVPGQFAEDSAHASGDLGNQMLAVRKDAQGSNVSADGDYSSLQTWSEGSLKVVDISNGTILQQQVTVSSTAAQVPASNLANRKSLMLQNTASGKMWIGSSTVTTSGATAGIELPANSFMELEVGPAVNVYAIKNGGGTLNLNILELA